MGYIGIVDPYSSGQFLAAEFASRNYKSIAIHSCFPIPSVFARSYYPDNFAQETFFTGSNFDELLALLRECQCTSVVAGAESGVILANRLAFELGLPSCVYSKLDSLRDKFLMQEQIKLDGLRSIRQFQAFSTDEALVLLPELHASRVVVKPLSSCGTDGVSFCENSDQVKLAVENIMHSNNCFGDINLGVLIQEYVSGVEYVVDTVSLDGTHYVTNTSRYDKVQINGSFVYQQERFIHPTDPEVSSLLKYGLKVLTSLGIDFGAAHMEIIVDKHGPVLVEVGARLHGAKAPRNSQFFSNISQIDLLVDAAVDPERFKARTARPPVYHKHSKAVSLINSQSGKVTAIPGKEWAASLSSFTLAFWNIVEGTIVEPTRGLFDSPGGIFLANESLEALESDTKLIRKMESEGKLWTVE
ncbi:ATP-grasp domain-containing protein [Pseudomonas tremae]|uniref:ATP-grasp domain-containing protein n=1 Tax=Pseudomonas tremae TaxID=200454 RepID=UPI001F340A16|nr:ATP-grasp domain-containing protein [Pseudomonas tremae]MCF5714915.1 ATP-grasp domain-containing protein [Pseudomonas tremae]UQB31804.1 ATP-grasp domain-containing protein [Pseudomonas tremae]